MDDSESSDTGDWDLVVSEAIKHGTWNPPLIQSIEQIGEELSEVLLEVDPFSLSEEEFDALLTKKEEEFRLRKKTL